jgi:hypothetical protein
MYKNIVLIGLLLIGCSSPKPQSHKDCFGVELREHALKMATFENESTSRMASDDFILNMNMQAYKNNYPLIHQDIESDITSCSDQVRSR